MIEIARAYPLEKSETVTRVPSQTVIRLAGEFRVAQKAVVHGRIGPCTLTFGGLCMRLVNVLNAVTGNLDEPGGSHFFTRACSASQSCFARKSGPLHPCTERSRLLARRSPPRHPLAGLPLPSANPATAT
jgi:anaerobic selenocysteine-containing dehydrogenase